MEADLCVQLNENAKLSGHQNHLQKIAYLDRLKDQVIKLEKVGNDVNARIGLNQLNELYEEVECGCDDEAIVASSSGALAAAATASAQGRSAETLPEMKSFIPIRESSSNLLPSVGNFPDDGTKESLSMQNSVCKSVDPCSDFDEVGSSSQMFSSSLIVPQVRKTIDVGSSEIREWMRQLTLSPCCVAGRDRQMFNETFNNGFDLAQKLTSELDPSESCSPVIRCSSPKPFSHFSVTKPARHTKGMRSFLEISPEDNSLLCRDDAHSDSQATKNKVNRRPGTSKPSCCTSNSIWKNSETREILSMRIAKSNELQSFNLFQDSSDDESLLRSESCQQDARKCLTDNANNTKTSTFQCILKRNPELPTSCNESTLKSLMHECSSSEVAPSHTSCNEPTLESLMDEWPRSEVARSRARRLVIKTISKAKSSRKESPLSERKSIL